VEEHGRTGVVIVCPTSLKHQWEREIARFTDRRGRVVGYRYLGRIGKTLEPILLRWQADDGRHASRVTIRRGLRKGQPGR
jgi:hypothetical protein